MSAAEAVIVVCLTTLALAHSILGESGILKPLFAAKWNIVDTPRWAAERILRFAWHLTSIAWLALAAIVAGFDWMPIVGVMSLVSAAMIFVMLRGHLAWPLFLLAGLAAFRVDGLLTSDVLTVAGIGTAAVLVAAAGLHVYWALGGSWMRDRATPPVETTGFEPGPALTLAVAGALTVFAGLVVLAALREGPNPLRWLVMVGVAVLTVRAIGDNRVAGFTKKDRSTAFALADDRWFTPLMVFLALGATGALLT